MSDLSPVRREELAWEVTYGCGCYSGKGLCDSCRIMFDRIAPLIAGWLAEEYQRGYDAGCDDPESVWTSTLIAEREAGAAEVRARVEAVAGEWQCMATVLDHPAEDEATRARGLVMAYCAVRLRAALNGGE